MTPLTIQSEVRAILARWQPEKMTLRGLLCAVKVDILMSELETLPLHSKAREELAWKMLDIALRMQAYEQEWEEKQARAALPGRAAIRG